jgi:transcriptional regulator with XRE-family HTH domain
MSNHYEVASIFGRNLKRIREQVGMSQEELAWLASIHRTEISQLERALRIPRLDTVVKLRASLEAPFEELLRGIDWDPGSVRVGSFKTVTPEARDGGD